MAYAAIRRPYLTLNNINYELQYDRTNGQVRVIQQNGQSIIFQNGNWVNNAGGLSPDEQNAKRTEIISLVNSSYTSNSQGSQLPQWARLDTNGNPQNAVSNPTEGGEGIGQIINTALNPQSITELGNNALYGPNNESELYSDRSLMKYPKDLMTDQQDTLIIEQYVYVPAKAEDLLGGNFQNIIGTNGGLGRTSPIGNARTKENLVGMVFLPMPNSLGESREVAWGGDTMSNLNAAALSKTAGNVGGAVAAQLAGGAAAALTNILTKGRVNLPPGGVAKGVGMVDLYGSLMNNAGTEAASMAGTTLLSQYLAQLGIGIEADAILARGAGVVPNNNLELLFTGPNLRSFTVSYKLTARSADEARNIRRIIRFFKQGMSPKKKSGGAGGRSFFLRTPNVFKLRFTTVGNADIKGVTRVKVCALTNFQTDYTPNQVWAAYDEGQPVSTAISLSFTELEPIFDTDFQSTVDENRSDLDQISNESVGY